MDQSRASAFSGNYETGGTDSYLVAAVQLNILVFRNHLAVKVRTVCAVMIFEKICISYLLNYRMVPACKLVVHNNIIVAFPADGYHCDKLDTLLVKHKVRCLVSFRNCIKMTPDRTVCSYCYIFHIYPVYSDITVFSNRALFSALSKQACR